VRADDGAKVPLAVVEYHIYRRHFLAFRMSPHAFLEIMSEVMAQA
jgi:hypothetical protein